MNEESMSGTEGGAPQPEDGPAKNSAPRGTVTLTRTPRKYAMVGGALVTLVALAGAAIWGREKLEEKLKNLPATIGEGSGVARFPWFFGMLLMGVGVALMKARLPAEMLLGLLGAVGFMGAMFMVERAAERFVFAVFSLLLLAGAAAGPTLTAELRRFNLLERDRLMNEVHGAEDARAEALQRLREHEQNVERAKAQSLRAEELKRQGEHQKELEVLRDEVRSLQKQDDLICMELGATEAEVNRIRGLPAPPVTPYADPPRPVPPVLQTGWGAARKNRDQWGEYQQALAVYEAALVEVRQTHAAEVARKQAVESERTALLGRLEYRRAALNVQRGEIERAAEAVSLKLESKQLIANQN
jgi:hypothetical protein